MAAGKTAFLTLKIHIMGLFGKIFKLGMDVVSTPISIVSDVFTMGGAAIEKPSEVVKKFNQIGEDWNEIKDELDK